MGYKKKYKQMRKVLKDQKIKLGSLDDATQQQTIESEVQKIREKYEQEFSAKLELMHRESEAQVSVQKEKMRQLVRALLAREGREKRGEPSYSRAGDTITPSAS